MMCTRMASCAGLQRQSTGMNVNEPSFESAIWANDALSISSQSEGIHFKTTPSKFRRRRVCVSGQRVLVLS